jgi:RecB family exonuclease
VRPEERLDFRLQGEIVHEVLRIWRAQGEAEQRDIAAIFEEVFASSCVGKFIPLGYHTERLRNQILEDLQRFAADTQWERAKFASRTEEKFDFAVGEGLQIKGRIDRVDTEGCGSAYIFDYKYSAPEQLKKKRDGLQGPVYLLAAERAFEVKPAGMFFVALKGGVKYFGFSDTGVLESPPIPEEWGQTPERIAEIAAAIREGRIAPGPADTKTCGYCDWRDICRIEATGDRVIATAGEAT